MSAPHLCYSERSSVIPLPEGGTESRNLLLYFLQRKGVRSGELPCSRRYGGVISRTGTGEEPASAVPVALVPLPQPATFRTVTFTLPHASTWLMNT
jgi:hypothetical protein